MEHTRNSPARRPPDPDPEGREPGTNPWLLIGTLIGAKIGTIVIILAVSWNSQTGGMVAANNWHWLPVIGALLVGPITWQVRLRRARRQRAALLRAEWMVEGVDSGTSGGALPPHAVDSGTPPA